jgi:hypothetical protein
MHLVDLEVPEDECRVELWVEGSHKGCLANQAVTMNISMFPRKFIVSLLPHVGPQPSVIALAVLAFMLELAYLWWRGCALLPSTQ